MILRGSRQDNGTYKVIFDERQRQQTKAKANDKQQTTEDKGKRPQKKHNDKYKRQNRKTKTQTHTK